MASKTDTLRVGIVGLGAIATYAHIPCLLADSRVRAISGADPDEYQRGRASRQFGLRHVYTSPEQLLNEEPLDAVVVAVPTPDHQEIVEHALGAGLHVLCEKPMGMDPQRAERLFTIAEQSNQVLAVGYHSRFEASIQRAREIVGSGRLGTIHQVRAAHIGGGPYLTWEPMSPWHLDEAAGGVLYDVGSHVFDSVRYLLGRESVSIVGAQRRFDGRMLDQTVVSWELEGGVLGTAVIGWGGRPPYRSTELFCEAGVLTVTPTETTVRGPAHSAITDFFTHVSRAGSIARDLVVQRRRGGPPAPYLRQIAAFLDALEGKPTESLAQRDAVGTLMDLEAVRCLL